MLFTLKGSEDQLAANGTALALTKRIFLCQCTLVTPASQPSEQLLCLRLAAAFSSQVCVFSSPESNGSVSVFFSSEATLAWVIKPHDSWISICQVYNIGRHPGEKTILTKKRSIP